MAKRPAAVEHQHAGGPAADMEDAPYHQQEHKQSHLVLNNTIVGFRAKKIPRLSFLCIFFM